jgi:hypothetical protein
VRFASRASAACARKRSIGTFATTAKLIGCAMCGTLPSIASMIDGQDGQPASSGRPASPGLNMKLYRKSVSLPFSNNSESRTGRAALARASQPAKT